MAKFLCEKASEANPDAHCRIRNVLINDRRLAKDPVQDVSLWGVLTAESSTPSLEFDYFGEDEGILKALAERELAAVVQNDSTSARGRQQNLNSPTTSVTKKESSFKLQLRKLSNKLNFARACEVHRWRSAAAKKTNEKQKMKDGAFKEKQEKTVSTASFLVPPSPSPPPPSLRAMNPYETFYASYFLPSTTTSSSSESSSNLKHIFSSLDQYGGGTLSLYEFKKGATDVLGVKIDRNILEPYFSATRARARLVSEGHEREKIDFRAFQEGVVDYDAFERICSEWLEREEEKERTRSGVIASTS